MKQRTYIVPGKPIPLARVRFGDGKAYDSQKNFKLAAGLFLVSQHGGLPLYDGPLHLDLTFYMPISKKAKSVPYSPHYYKPDLSNLIKFIEDVAIGILYKDDALVCSISAQKIYDENARTQLIIKEIDEDKKEKDLIW